MKKLVWLLSFVFVLTNITGIVLYFSFDVDLYQEYLGTQIDNQSLQDVQDVYHFLEEKGELPVVFSPLEVSHLQDVQDVFSVIFIVFWCALSLCIFLTFYFLFMPKYDSLLRGFFLGSLISLSIVLFLFLFVLFDFTWAFDVFHYVFFPQGNWSFEQGSYLVTLFPIGFFITISQKIFFSIALVSSIILILYFFIKKSPLGRKISDS